MGPGWFERLILLRLLTVCLPKEWIVGLTDRPACKSDTGDKTNKHSRSLQWVWFAMLKRASEWWWFVAVVVLTRDRQDNH